MPAKYKKDLPGNSYPDPGREEKRRVKKPLLFIPDNAVSCADRQSGATNVIRIGNSVFSGRTNFSFNHVPTLNLHRCIQIGYGKFKS
jgi:hypothetical protein